MVSRLVLPISIVLLVATATGGFAQDVQALLDKVTALEEEGTKWFNVAGNTDLSFTKRNEARKKAYVVLREAQKLLVDYIGENATLIDRHEDQLAKIHRMIYWIRKESPLNLLPKEDEEKAENPWKDIPKPRDLDKPALPPKPGPGPGPGPGPRPGPAKPVAPSPEELFGKAESFEKGSPWDVGGALTRYREFMARHPDPDSPLFQKALERSAVLNERLKGAYRELRQEDPDALDPKRMLSPAERVLVVRLSRDLKDKSDERRRRAAIDLGLLGSGEGAYHLLKRIKIEKVEAVVKACREAMVRIGGKKTTEVLSTLSRSRRTEELLLAVDLLTIIAKKDAVQGRYAAHALSGFVHSADGNAGQTAFDALAAMGSPCGVDGLCEALKASKAPVTRRLLIIETLGRMKDPRAAQVLGRFLLQKGNRLLKDASIESLKKLGNDTVPHLIPFLQGPTRIWTGYALRQITGQNFGSKASLWQQWWKNYEATRR